MPASSLPATANVLRAERSRAAILDAATQEFLQHGYEGASVNKIAERAVLNKRMLYHYFDNKEGLWCAVLEAAYQRLRSGEAKLDLAEHEPVEAMRRLVRFSFRHLVDNPDFVTLLNIENLHRAVHLKASAQIRGMHSPLIKTLTRVLEAGRDSGQFSRAVDPVELYVLMSSLCFFHLSNRFTLSVIFDRDLGSEAAIDARCEEVVAMVVHYLTAPAPA